MNYLKVYCNLIRKAENRTPPEGYTERHHTFPKSVFGENMRIVILTSREHYIAHALLEKVFIKRYGGNDKKAIKMSYAFWMMNHKRFDNYRNSKMYETIRIKKSSLRKGYKHTEESKKKISESRKGQVSPNKGKPMNLEQKIKLSEAHKGKLSPKKGIPISEEQKIKISETLKGTKQSEETKKKRADNLRGRKRSEETRKRMSEATKGKPKSEEHKKKLSELGKLIYQKKVGIFAKTKEEMSAQARKVNSQRWKCLVTEYISNAGGLSRFQKARGIDTSQRVRVELQ